MLFLIKIKNMNAIYELATGYMYEIKVKEYKRGCVSPYYTTLGYCITKYDPVIQIRNDIHPDASISPVYDLIYIQPFS